MDPFASAPGTPLLGAYVRAEPIEFRYGDDAGSIKWWELTVSMEDANRNGVLDAGEDPMFVARRLVIFASEDIGEADRGSLLVATAALEAVRSVGMPEARYPLGQAVLTLAHAKKSRGVVEAFAATSTTIRRDPPS